MNLKLLPGLLLLLVLSCKEIKKEKTDAPVPATGILGSWQVYDVDLRVAPNMKKAFKRVADMAVDKGAMITFFPDGSCTEFNGEGFYKTGRWKYTEEKQSVVLSADTVNRSFTVKQYAKADTQYLELGDAATLGKRTYIMYAPAVKDINKSPFAPVNNTWRIKPAQSETPQQQQQRLGLYLEYLLCLLRSAMENHQQMEVDFRYSGGAVQIYSGGVGAQNKTKVPRSWKETFFNDAEAWNAYSMLRGYFEVAKYKSKGGGNWVKVDCDILESMISDLHAGKFPIIQTPSKALFSEERK